MPVIQRCSSASHISRLLAALFILLGSLPAGAQTADPLTERLARLITALPALSVTKALCWKRHSGPHWRFSSRANRAISGIRHYGNRRHGADSRRETPGRFFPDRSTGHARPHHPEQLQLSTHAHCRLAAVSSGQLERLGWRSRQLTTSARIRRTEPGQCRSAVAEVGLCVSGSHALESTAGGHSEVVFTGSQDGTVYALDRNNGCPIWTYSAEGSQRSLYVDTDEQGVPEMVLFGKQHAYALHAQTGELLWKTPAHDHEAAIVTGSVIAHDGTGGTGFLPEVILASRTDYECCTFRGALVALDIETGEELAYLHDRPAPAHDSQYGRTQQYDRQGHLSGPVRPSMQRVIWSMPVRARIIPHLPTAKRCGAGGQSRVRRIGMVSTINPGRCLERCLFPACARWQEDVPDYDIGAAPILTRDEHGREVLLVGQKSGMVYALDPADDGRLLWEQRAGSGGTMGGIHYGMSASPSALFVGVSDLPINNPYNRVRAIVSMLSASAPVKFCGARISAISGRKPFSLLARYLCCGEQRRGTGCNRRLDGILRAFDPESGDVLETATQSFGT